MKRVGRVGVLFFVAAVLLAGTAFANSAPPDYLLVVRLVNAPEEPYYLDLLAEGAGEPSNRNVQRDSDEGLAGPDNDLLDSLRGEIPEGWESCTMGSSSQLFLHGSGKDGVHRFSGLDTPGEFRIIIMTQSGEVWSSDTMERRALQDAVTVDWERKIVSVMPIWLAVALQTLSTLLLTLLVEGLMLLVFGFDWKKNWKPFLLVNLVTQGGLALFLSANIVRSGVGAYGMILYGVLLLPIEGVIAFAEAVLYAKFFQGKPAGRAFAYGLTANALSYVVGLFAVQAVWERLVRVLWLGSGI